MKGLAFEETNFSYLSLLQPAGCDSCQAEWLFTKIYPSEQNFCKDLPIMGISPDLSSQQTRRQYRHIHAIPSTQGEPAPSTPKPCPCLKVQPAPPLGATGFWGSAQDSSSSHHPWQVCYAQFRDNNSSSKASALQLAQ